MKCTGWEYYSLLQFVIDGKYAEAHGRSLNPDSRYVVQIVLLLTGRVKCKMQITILGPSLSCMLSFIVVGFVTNSFSTTLFLPAEYMEYRVCHCIPYNVFVFLANKYLSASDLFPFFIKLLTKCIGCYIIYG